MTAAIGRAKQNPHSFTMSVQQWDGRSFPKPWHLLEDGIVLSTLGNMSSCVISVLCMWPINLVHRQVDSLFRKGQSTGKPEEWLTLAGWFVAGLVPGWRAEVGDRWREVYHHLWNTQRVSSEKRYGEKKNVWDQCFGKSGKSWQVWADTCPEQNQFSRFDLEESQRSWDFTRLDAPSPSEAMRDIRLQTPRSVSL